MFFPYFSSRLCAAFILGCFSLFLPSITRADSSNPYFGLSSIRTPSGKLLSATDFGNSDYCGHCHTQIFQEWNASSHHFSSFNNPVYRKVVLDVASRKGAETVKFCASCHDPLPLVSGELDDLEKTTWSLTAGITCLACHRITDVGGPNGNYKISPPALHPFALSDNLVLQKLHKAGLSLTPWLHKAVMTKNFYASSEFCATCHTLTAPKALNGLVNIGLMDEHAQLKARNQKEQSETVCRDCHMPLVPSSDPAAKNGLIRSHAFSASNTFLPSINRDHRQVEAVEAFLQNQIIALELDGIRRNNRGNFDPPGETPIRQGDNIEIILKATNTGVGHNFPGGTADSNEAWISMEIFDATGQRIFASGVVDEHTELPADAKKFMTTFIDGLGNVTNRRNSTTDAVAIHSENVIAPFMSKLLEYRFKVPADAPLPLRVEATLNWRKYNPGFVDWVFEGKGRHPAPITPIARLSRPLGIQPR